MTYNLLGHSFYLCNEYSINCLNKSRSTRKKDLNQLARFITDRATNEDTEKPVKNEAAVALGRLGGLKGGKARADSLTTLCLLQLR